MSGVRVLQPAPAAEADRTPEIDTIEVTVDGEVRHRQRIVVAEANHDQRYEWQAVGEENKPLFIGTAESGTPESIATWIIQRYTWAVGPAGGAVPALIQTRIGSWAGREALFA